MSDDKRKRLTPILSGADRRTGELAATITHLNPFLPERLECERAALGSDFQPVDPVWSVRPDLVKNSPNVRRLRERVDGFVARARRLLEEGGAFNDADTQLYEDLVLFRLYYRFESRFHVDPTKDKTESAGATFKDFVTEIDEWLRLPGLSFPAQQDPAHVFACFFQMRRAFHHIFYYIAGGSEAARALRSQVWHSIFTHDMRRYRRAIYERMGDITTLITGASGTGKELVARAIGLSRYIPFDRPKGRFAKDDREVFNVLNVAALSPTLVESELFGHRRGAFTGALEDRIGWLEACPPHGTVFLDEVGEIEPSIQVKLLRVLQERTFQRLGETGSRLFQGKIIAATNRDLAAEIRAGRFRSDLLYRLCSDLIRTPTLKEQIEQSTGALKDLVEHMSRRIAGEREYEQLTGDVLAWIQQNLGPTYAWPGNVRELEQCVRNILIRGEYRPLSEAQTKSPESNDLGDYPPEMASGSWSAEDVLSWYCKKVYGLTGSFVETARRLGLDRRTVKAKIVPGEKE